MPSIAWLEDDAYVFESIVAPLERAGYDIKIYANVAEALGAVDELRFCLVLLVDVRLPSGDMDNIPEEDEPTGLILLRTLRRLGVTTPAIIVSATELHAYRGLIDDDQLPVQAWFQRPFSGHDLLREVERLS